MRAWRSLALIVGSLGYAALDRLVQTTHERDAPKIERLGGRILVVAGVMFVGAVIVGLLGALVLGATAGVLMAVRDRAARCREIEEIRRGVPEVVGLLGVAASAGLNPHRSIQVVSELVNGPIAPLMARAGALARAGYTAAESLTSIAEASGLDEFRSMSRAFGASERQGAPLAPTLRRLGRDLAEQRRRRAEAAARKAPVRVLFPLVVCVLPAFVLLAVVPVFVDTLNVVRA